MIKLTKKQIKMVADATNATNQAIPSIIEGELINIDACFRFKDERKDFPCDHYASILREQEDGNREVSPIILKNAHGDRIKGLTVSIKGGEEILEIFIPIFRDYEEYLAFKSENY